MERNPRLFGHFAGTHATQALAVAFRPLATSFALLKKQVPCPLLDTKNVLATHDFVAWQSAQQCAGSVAGCCGARAPSFQSLFFSNLQWPLVGGSGGAGGGGGGGGGCEQQ